ncbi:MAG: hypothetical protein HC942_27160 [Microcoleus sp. SU_5_6]|nr:hypothetical protein [Microcoleus sp. SU_5_6]
MQWFNVADFIVTVCLASGLKESFRGTNQQMFAYYWTIAFWWQYADSLLSDNARTIALQVSAMTFVNSSVFLQL